MKEAQPSARRVSQASDPMQSAANAGEGGSQFRQELLARFSGCDAARRAREQPDTDLFLESANRMTEGGLRHSGPLSAFVKLRSSATARNADIRLSSSRTIPELSS